jgi:hypothetical protein
MMKLMDTIDYHDFSLRSYTVRDYGRSILLDLISRSEPTRETALEFTDVIYHRFIHPGPAFITHIHDLPFMDAIRELGIHVPEDFRQHGGLPKAFPSNEDYGAYFESEGFRTWLISSAIGFAGIVVGRRLLHVNG